MFPSDLTQQKQMKKEIGILEKLDMADKVKKCMDIINRMRVESTSAKLLYNSYELIVRKKMSESGKSAFEICIDIMEQNTEKTELHLLLFGLAGNISMEGDNKTDIIWHSPPCDHGLSSTKIKRDK